MSCGKDAHKCKGAGAAVGIADTTATWAEGRRGGGHCPRCGGFLTAEGVCNKEGCGQQNGSGAGASRHCPTCGGFLNADGACNSPRHAWVEEFEREAAAYGLTSNDVMDMDGWVDAEFPNDFVPDEWPGEYMARMANKYGLTPLDDDGMSDSSPHRPTREELMAALAGLVDELKPEVNIPVSVKGPHAVAQEMLDAPPSLRGEAVAALQDLVDACRDAGAADDAALNEAERILRLERETMPPPVSVGDKLRDELQNLLNATKERRDYWNFSHPWAIARQLLGAGASPPPQGHWYALSELVGGAQRGTPHLPPEIRAEADRAAALLRETAGEIRDWRKGPLTDEDYADRRLATVFRGWLSAVADTDDGLDREASTHAIRHILGFAGRKQWRRDDIIESETMAKLLRRADLSQINPDDTAMVYRTYLSLAGNTMQERQLTKALVANPTAPAEALRAGAIDRLMYGAGYTKGDVVALAQHPSLEKTDREMLAGCPNRAAREAIAAGEGAEPDVLRRMVKDPDVKVALSALRNPKHPYAKAVETGRKNGVPDTQLLENLRRKTRTWRDIPRCGVCGAWAGQDGVCNNRRCAAKGTQTAPVHRWPPLSQIGLGVEVSDVVYRSLTSSRSRRSHTESRREMWVAAMTRKDFPKAWRPALVDGVQQLVAVGHYTLPGDYEIAWNERYGAYTLDGVPVPADNPGEAMRTALKVLADQPPPNDVIGNLAEQLVEEGELNIAGKTPVVRDNDDGETGAVPVDGETAQVIKGAVAEGDYRPDYQQRKLNAARDAVQEILEQTGAPVYRYSPGYGSLVPITTPEPKPVDVTAPLPDAGALPEFPPEVPKQWHETRRRNGQAVFAPKNLAGGKDVLVAHCKNSPGYRHLRPDKATAIKASEVQRAVRLIGHATGDNSRPILSRVWGLPPGGVSSLKDYGITSSNGTWVATDGFRALFLNVEGEQGFTRSHTINPNVAKLAGKEGTILFDRENEEEIQLTGKETIAFTGKTGHVIEASWDGGRFPDLNVVIPSAKETNDWAAFEITGRIPKEMLKAGDATHLGILVARGDELVIRIKKEEGDDELETVVGKIKGDRLDNLEDGVLGGVNMRYFNNMVGTTPSGKKGHWTVRLEHAPENSLDGYVRKPLVFTHDGGNALGVLMPMRVN